MRHCCETMTRQVNYECDEHPNPYDCPEKLIHYDERFDEYGIIIHDGGESSVTIFYCPWCGSKLPDSKRELWFDVLDDLGFDNPLEQEIPTQYKTGKWYEN
ncbi:DUF6980 family protein [Aquibacillus salsiterrae]|uniref:DUF6980 domain-containing protein n=1 Tax=Aquibacillus salsiterrae TaxID=2950439 RepID=A0A9X3WDU5_9BACI|nr:hypothetical protein [Aquibacillus salsiterrae]MDC3416310.1 hypothetical protein [Aquibacillus salsiterrae]